MFSLEDTLLHRLNTKSANVLNRNNGLELTALFTLAPFCAVTIVAVAEGVVIEMLLVVVVVADVALVVDEGIVAIVCRVIG